MNRYVTRPTLRHLLTPLGAAFALATGGCDGSELVRPIDESAGAVPAVGIDFAFQVGAETVGFGQDAVSLDRAAEDPAYFGTRGFQVDVGAIVVGQPAGGLLRLSLDGEVVAETQGAGALVVGGLFRGVMLPYQAEPLNVELAYFRTTVGEDGNAIPDETPALRVAKAVTLTGDPATCEVTVDVGATEAGCAPLTLDPASGEPGNLGVAWRVTRTAGACDTLSGTVSGPDGVVLGALEGTFDPDGVASGFFALGPALDAEAVAAHTAKGAEAMPGTQGG
jgi:hypothetical protein